jgi:hypothetical protein
MRKKLVSIFICIIISLSIASCGAKEASNDGIEKGNVALENNEKVVAVKEEILEVEVIELKVDWDKCIEDTKAELTNTTNFNYLKNVFIKVEDKRITFTAVLADATNDEVALDFSDTILRRFNANAQLQDSSIKSSGNDYLGGIYDIYDISIGIAPFSKIESQKEWYVFDAIAKKVQREPKLQK